MRDVESSGGLHTFLLRDAIVWHPSLGPQIDYHDWDLRGFPQPIQVCPWILSHGKSLFLPIRVASRSKAWTDVTHLNTRIVGSNRTQGMDVCVRLFCACVVLCVGSGLATGWSSVQEVLHTVYRIKKLKKWTKPTRAVEPEINKPLSLPFASLLIKYSLIILVLDAIGL
jgi:hypothetical protein